MEKSDSKQAPQASQASVSKSSKKKWSLKKKLVVFFGSVIAFVLAILLFVNVATSAPLKVSDELVANIQAGNSSAAYDLFSSDAQNATSSQDFEATIDNIGPILSGKPNVISKEVSTETGSNPTATIVYEIPGSDDITYQLTVNLVENDGKWEVLNFESIDKNKLQDD